MCLEDLRLARGYQYGTPAVFLADTPTNILPADARRIGIIIGHEDPTTPEILRLCQSISQLIPFAIVTNDVLPRKLMIFDYGQLITGPICNVAGSATGSNWIITPIYTDVSALPISTLEDMKRANPQGVQ